MKSILFITSRFPYPLDKGDKLRAYNQIKSLSKIAEIHLVSLSETEPSVEEFSILQKYCKSVTNYVLPKYKRFFGLVWSVFSGAPFSVGYFFSFSIKRKINRLIRELNPDIMHCHLIRCSEYVSTVASPVMSLDYMDCFSLGALKELKSTNSWFRKWFLKFEYPRLLKYEKKVFDQFDKHCIISETDRNALPVKNPNNVEVVSNGVDRSIFYPFETDKQYDLLFSGHMGYIPNISAAKYAATEIIPKLPSSIRLLVAGIGATTEIKRLQNDQVIVQEKFPHIREAFWVSKILVASVNISIGLQNKIIQAMAMKIPVVCSPVANASIKAPVGTCILEANNPEEYVNAISLLLNDSDYYQSIASEAYKFVKSHFDWDSINLQYGKKLIE